MAFCFACLKILPKVSVRFASSFFITAARQFYYYKHFLLNIAFNLATKPSTKTRTS
nr:hypothetical protein [uncultured Campylobacter sp.]